MRRRVAVFALALALAIIYLTPGTLAATDVTYDFTEDGLGDFTLSSTNVAWAWTEGTGYVCTVSGSGDKYIQFSFDVAGAPSSDTMTLSFTVYCDSVAGGGTVKIRGAKSDDGSTWTNDLSTDGCAAGTYTTTTMGYINPAGTDMYIRLKVEVATAYAGSVVTFKNFTLTGGGTIDNFMVTTRDYSTLAGATGGTFTVGFTDGTTSSATTTRPWQFVQGDKSVNYVKYGDRMLYRSWNTTLEDAHNDFYHLLSGGSIYYYYVIDSSDTWGVGDYMVIYPPVATAYQNFDLTPGLVYDTDKLTTSKAATLYLTGGSYGVYLMQSSNWSDAYNFGTYPAESPLYLEYSAGSSGELGTNITVPQITIPTIQNATINPDYNTTALALGWIGIGVDHLVTSSDYGTTGVYFMFALPVLLLLIAGKHYAVVAVSGALIAAGGINIMVGTPIWSWSMVGILAVIAVLMVYSEKRPSNLEE